MNISIKLKKIGEQLFYIQPYSEMNLSGETDFILVRCTSEINNPMFRLHLNPCDKKFKVDCFCEIDETDSIFDEKMNHLALDVFEALQQGVDLAAVDIPNTIGEDKPYNPDLIRVEPSTISLRQVNDMIKDGDINLSPDFQRNSIWDKRRKCRLIESILLRIPLPVFYFSADETGKLYVVDGLQRLTAIKEFMSNSLPLSDLEYLNDCNGCTYNGTKKLEERLYRRFNLTQITINVIDASSPTKVKYDVFKRLNTGGRPLNSQELRNCLSSNDLRSALKKMAQSKEFLNATTRSISDDRMDAQESALRFLYFRNLYLRDNKKIDAYTGTMDSALDDFVDFLSKSESFDYDKYITDFKRAMNNAEYLFGRHAFRKVTENTQINDFRSVINKALFICLSILLADYDESIVKTKCEKNSWISILGKEISSDSTLMAMISYGTNGWKNLIYCLNKMNKLIESQMKNEESASN